MIEDVWMINGWISSNLKEMNWLPCKACRKFFEERLGTGCRLL